MSRKNAICKNITSCTPHTRQTNYHSGLAYPENRVTEAAAASTHAHARTLAWSSSHGTLDTLQQGQGREQGHGEVEGEVEEEEER